VAAAEGMLLGISYFTILKSGQELSSVICDTQSVITVAKHCVLLFFGIHLSPIARWVGWGLGGCDGSAVASA